MTTAETTKIRVIVFKDADQWVAQALEHDVSVQAPDLDTLRGRMEVALNAEAPFEGIGQAPEHFFKLWDKKSDFSKPGVADGVAYDMALCA